jgi:hypothetical protein
LWDLVCLGITLLLLQLVNEKKWPDATASGQHFFQQHCVNAAKQAA